MRELNIATPPDTRRTQKASCTSAQPMATAILDAGNKIKVAAANVMVVSTAKRRRVEIIGRCV
jgi:hypothetical protein